MSKLSMRMQVTRIQCDQGYHVFDIIHLAGIGGVMQLETTERCGHTLKVGDSVEVEMRIEAPRLIY